MATLSITVPDAEVPRIAAAIGDRMGLRDSNGVARVATAAEMRGWIVDRLKEITRSHETNLAVVAAAAGVTDVNPS